jgi:outer membrane protein TolC
MRRIIVILMLISGIVHAQDNVLHLQDCYEKMLVNYPLANQTEIYSAQSELKIKNIKTGWLPNTSLNAQATYQSDAITVNMNTPSGGFGFEGEKDQYKATVDINQLIYDWGRIKAAKQLESAGLQVNQQANNVELNKIKEQVNTFYFAILTLQKNEELLKVMLKDLEAKEQIVASGVKNGMLLKSDLSALKAEILKVKQSIAELQLQRYAAIDILAELTGMEIQYDIVLEIPEYTIDNQTNYSRPELVLFDYQKEQLELTSKVISKQTKPTFFAFSQLGYGKPGLNMVSDEFDSYYYVGVGLKWNFWDWNKTKREKQIVSLNKNLITSQENTFTKQLNIALKNEKSRIKALEESIATDQEIIKLREQVTESARVKLDNGTITSSDYISELTAETQAKLKYETHKIQLVQSNVNYLYIKGEI